MHWSRLREMRPEYDFGEFDFADSRQYLKRYMTENGN